MDIFLDSTITMLIKNDESNNVQISEKHPNEEEEIEKWRWSDPEWNKKEIFAVWQADEPDFGSIHSPKLAILVVSFTRQSIEKLGRSMSWIMSMNYEAKQVTCL